MEQKCVEFIWLVGRSVDLKMAPCEWLWNAWYSMVYSWWGDWEAQRNRYTGVICHIKPNPPRWVIWKIYPSLTPWQRFVRGAPASLKTTVTALFCMPDLMVGATITQLGNLRTMSLTGSQDGRGQAGALNSQRQGVPTVMDSRCRTMIRMVWHM